MESSRPSFRKQYELKAASQSNEKEVFNVELFSEDLSKIDSILVDKLLDSATDTADLRQAWSIRSFITERYIESLKSNEDTIDTTSKAQFDLMVDKAEIYSAAGYTLRYLEELDIAETFALSNDLNNEAELLKTSLDKMVDQLSTTPREVILKLRGSITFNNRNFLRQLTINGINYHDFMNYVHSMILAEDGKPNDVLSQLGVNK
jgi:hypothetical protein